MSRAQAFLIGGQVTSMDMSPDNASLAVGGKQNIKIMGIKPESENWFESKKSINRHKGPYGQKKPTAVTSLSWSRNMVLAVATTYNTVYLYDFNDFNNNKYEDIVQSVFQEEPAKKVSWDPQNQNTLVACSRSQLINYDTLSKSFTALIEIDEISDYQYCPTNSHLIAITAKTDKIYLYDMRNYEEPIIVHDNLLPSHNNIPVHWNSDGTMLATSSGVKLKTWSINGQKLSLTNKIYHPQTITSFRWLKTNQFLVLQNKLSTIIKYEQPNHCIGQYLAYIDPKYNVTAWAMNNKQDIVITANSYQYESNSSIMVQFSDNLLYQRDSRYNYPLQFDQQDRLLLNAKRWNKKRIEQSFPILLTQREHGKSLEDYNYFEEFNREKMIQQQLVGERKRERVKKKEHKKQLKKKIIDILKQQESFKSLDKKKKSLQKQSPAKLGQKESPAKLGKKQSPAKLSKKQSQMKMQKAKSGSNDKKKRNPKQSMRSIHHSQEYSSSSDEQQKILNNHKYICCTKQQFQFLAKNYRVDIDRKNWRQVILHNAHTAKKLQKNLCAEFWKVIFTIASSDQEKNLSINEMYQENKKFDISFQNNKITLNCEQPPLRPSLDRKKIIHQLLQNLVDQNQLQTASIAACLLIKLYPTRLLLDETLFHKIMASYKMLLRKMGLSMNSIETSQIAKIVGEYEIGYNITYQFKIRCTLCGKRMTKCLCPFICIFCQKGLKQRMVTVCQICGHAGHTLQYRKWFIQDGNVMCPYGCGHQCYASIYT